MSSEQRRRIQLTHFREGGPHLRWHAWCKDLHPNVCGYGASPEEAIENFCSLLLNYAPGPGERPYKGVTI